MGLRAGALFHGLDEIAIVNNFLYLRMHPKRTLGNCALLMVIDPLDDACTAVRIVCQHSIADHCDQYLLYVLLLYLAHLETAIYQT